jgi:hypothetical protein
MLIWVIVAILMAVKQFTSQIRDIIYLQEISNNFQEFLNI